MANEVVTTGGGALVPSAGDDGRAISESVGDMSIDRGGGRGISSQLHGDIQHAAGVALNGDQIQRVQRVLQRHRLAEDQRQKVVAYAAIKASWRAATEGNLVKIHGWLLDTMGKELADEFLGARDSDGTGICNKPAVLEAMLKAAHGIPDASNNNPGKGGSVPSQREREAEAARAAAARVSEIESWMGAPKGSDTWKKYYGDEKVQTEYRHLRENGVTADVTPKTADSGVERRIKEIEAFMAARPGTAEFKSYWNDPQIQEEYRELQRRRQ